MRYVALDLETTTLEPHPDHVLQIAAVLEDTARAGAVPVEELAAFTAYLHADEVVGQTYALAMNAQILRRISGHEPSPYQVLPRAEAWQAFGTWLDTWASLTEDTSGPPRLWTAAGKNVAGFDLQFLPDRVRARFDHRAIDVGSVFADWHEDRLPGLDRLVRAAGIRESGVTHDALEDARDVVRLLRGRYVPLERRTVHVPQHSSNGGF